MSPSRGRAIFIAAVLASMTVLSGCVERFYFYSPDKISYASPEEHGLSYEEVRFASADGTVLYGWFVPALGKRHGTIAYFHGNTKNISGHLRYVEWLPRHGYDVFLFDYRGYGRSGGSPTPRGVHEDCVAALAHLRTRSDVDQERIVIFGQSLGGNYALSALADMPRKGIRAILVEGAFASHREIALDKLAPYALSETMRNWLVDLLIDDAFDAVTALQHIDDVPVLLIHGSDDEVVPYRHAVLLLSAAAGPHSLWTIPNGRHLDTFVYRQEPWRGRLIRYLNAVTGDVLRPVTTQWRCYRYAGVDSNLTMSFPFCINDI